MKINKLIIYKEDLIGEVPPIEEIEFNHMPRILPAIVYTVADEIIYIDNKSLKIIKGKQ